MTDEVWIRCTRCGQRMLRSNAVYLSGHPYGKGCAEAVLQLHARKHRRFAIARAVKAPFWE